MALLGAKKNCKVGAQRSSLRRVFHKHGATTEKTPLLWPPPRSQHERYLEDSFNAESRLPRYSTARRAPAGPLIAAVGSSGPFGG